MSEESSESGGNTINAGHINNVYTGGEHHHYYSNIAAQNVESNAPTTSQALTQQQGVDQKIFVDQIQKSQLEKLKSDVVTHDKQVNEAEIPEVHPILVETDIYEGQQSDQNEEFIPSTKRKDKKNLDGKIVNFTTMISLVLTTHFLALVGPAGSGKTTLSKRIVRGLLNMGRFVILIKFMNLAYPHGFTLTLQDLILGHQFNELDKEIRGNAFEWMKQNPGECVLVFDGFDQFSWTLENVKSLNASYDTPLSVQQLIANLCSGVFLGKSHLVFTSRQHSMLSHPYDLRPNLTIYVHDLSTDDMKKLFFSFARDNANELWKIITAKSPQLLDLCHNPMLLQFIVCAGLYKGANHLDTITNIFSVVLLQIQHSSFSHGRQIDELKQLLGRMAYSGMESKKIIFETADLTKEGLKDVDVQDFVIKTPQHLGFPSQKLFEGDMKFFFVHQLLQEFFAAIYIAKYMPVSTFEQTIEEVVNEGHWSMVRRFLCGLLLRNQINEGKKQIFYKKLVEGIISFSGTLDQTEFFIDLQECSDEVKNSLASNLMVLNFTGAPMSSSACHALGDVLPRIPHEGVKLILIKQNLNFDSLKWIFTKGISKMKPKLELIDLSGNEFGDDGLKLISKHLNKMNGLRLFKCGITKHGIKVLVEGLKQLELHFLDLGGNKFEADGLKLISQHLNKVNVLVIRQCGITIDGIKILVEELKQLEFSLEEVDLCDNEFGDDGLTLVSQYLNKVKRLRLCRCGITIHGIKILVEALEILECPLELLALSGNEVSDDGLKLISEHLDKVKRLRMRECGITKLGIEYLVGPLNQLERPMEYLYVNKNDFGDDGLNLICQCLHKIKELNVECCGISESGKQMLREEISKRNLPAKNFRMEWQ